MADIINNVDYKSFLFKKFSLPYESKIIRDAEFLLTHYATSNIKETLCFVENDGYLIKANRNKNVTAIITTKEFAERVDDEKALLISSNPKKSFFEIHNKLKEKYSFKNKPNSIHETVDIHPTAVIGEGVTIGEGSSIGPYTIINDGSVIGKNVLIDNHVIIGARGMHNTKIDGTFVRVEDLGNVVIEDDCEILSHAVIQKPYFYHSTVIGEETRISIACNIGHGCEIGPRCLIAGHSIIAGYCTIGKDVWIGPNSTLSQMITVDDYSSIILGSVAIQDLKKGEIVSGNFAYDHVKNLKSYIKTKRDK